MTSTTPTPWTSVSNTWTRRATERLEAFLDEPGYTVAGCYERGDGQIAVVYSDPGAQGLFAVKIEDVDLTDEIEAGPDAYTEFCDGSTDLADEALARALLAHSETRTLKYSGACSAVLAEE